MEVSDIANIKIIYGPPCAGKSKHVNDNITEKDIKFDYDEILQAISNSDIHENREDLISYGIGIREYLIDNVSTDSSLETAYIITCKITDTLLDQIGTTDVEYVLIDKTKEEVLEQLRNDTTREDKEHWEGLVDDWFDWYEGYVNSNEKNNSVKGGEMMKKFKIQTRLEIKNEATSETAELYLYGAIRQAYWWDDEEDCISAQRVMNSLKELKGKNINVHISSNGGDVFESIAICNLLKQHDGDINVYVDAIAASGASIIAMAGKKVYMPANAMMMVHKAWTFTAGNSDQLKKIAEDLDKVDAAVKASYMSKFVGTEEELEGLLADETYLTADDCLTFGLCTEVLTESKDEETPPQNTKETLFNKYNKKIVAEVPKPEVGNQKPTLFNAFKKQQTGGN